MSIEKLVVGPGRVETLTDEQEKKLKQVWAYMLNFFGFKVVPPGVVRTASRRSTNASSIVSSDSKKKSGGFMGRFKRSSHKRSNSLEKLERVLSHHSTHSIDEESGFHYCFKGLDSKDMYEAFWTFLRHDTPDNLVLRFVRARKWNVDKAMVMMTNTMKWRWYEGKPDKVLFESELGCKESGKDGVMYQLEVGKCVIHGHDLKGRPIANVRARLHHSSDQTMDEVKIYTMMTIEYARLMLTEPVDTCDIVFNLSEMTMANMDYAAVSYMVKCFEAHYPESLGILFVHKAPWIFAGIWKIVRSWLDPVVASKIVFTNSTDDLAKYIDRKHILKELGGDSDFEWNYLQPTKSKNGHVSDDEEAKEAIEEERKQILSKFIHKTIDWIETTDGTASRALLDERIQIGRELAENYKKLDGYIRNRSVYDRWGDVTFKLPTD
ncbi:DEKNAAC102760 [Brettanomyces naardenensis]|uniref:DEKNAAC102760 n=1 Tax=Brettanomyces naardenensis TaxID=13370 RepID=A0A448YKS8_BRENA|nr:DEKNAAC102760 [Brettanomyces naardenensis]